MVHHKVSNISENITDNYIDFLFYNYNKNLIIYRNANNVDIVHNVCFTDLYIHNYAQGAKPPTYNSDKISLYIGVRNCLYVASIVICVCICT